MSHLSNFQAALAKAGFDAAIIGGKINQRYLSGFDFDDGYVLVTTKASYLLTDFRYIEAAEAQVKDFTILRPAGTMTEEIGKLLSDHGLRRLAVEEATLSYGDFTRFAEAFPKAELCSGASKILEELRVIKTPEELEKIVSRFVAMTEGFSFTELNGLRILCKKQGTLQTSRGICGAVKGKEGFSSSLPGIRLIRQNL